MTMTGRNAARWAVALTVVGATLAVGAQPAHANPPCGSGVAANLVLTGNMACAGTALVVTADNVVVDLNGFTLSGNGTGDGILVMRSRVTVRSGKISGFEYGIHMQGALETASDDNLVSRVTAQGNEEGIRLTKSNRTTITDSLLDANSVGVVMRVSSDRNRIVRSRITANNTGMVVTQGSDFNFAGGNAFTKNKDGILLINAAFDTLIEGNTITGNIQEGVQIKGPGTNRNVVRANRVESNGVGVYVCCGASLDDNQVLANTVVLNAGTGILVVDDTAQGTVVADNVVRRNGFGAPLDPRKPDQYDDGIHVEAVLNSDATITNNISDENADLGIEASGTIVDGGGNSAVLNGNPAQCVGVLC